MIKLLSFWLVWRAIRFIAAAAVVIGALALLQNTRAPRCSDRTVPSGSGCSLMA